MSFTQRVWFGERPKSCSMEWSSMDSSGDFWWNLMVRLGRHIQTPGLASIPGSDDSAWPRDAYQTGCKILLKVNSGNTHI